MKELDTNYLRVVVSDVQFVLEVNVQMGGADRKDNFNGKNNKCCLIVNDLNVTAIFDFF